MRIRLTFQIPGHTRFGVFQNVTNRIDREACGGWYFHVHCWPLQLQCYQTRTRFRFPFRIDD